MNRGLLVVALVGMGFAGCSGGTSQPTTAAGNPASSATVPAAPPKQPIAVPAAATPDQVVSVFLSALRSGDEATTAHLLTTRAREETSKHGIAVDPQSAPNAKYEVHPAEILAENPHGAHVTSVWSETYDDGTVTYQIVWVLRRETPGWRIAGMALELIPGQPPAFLNFEDPADMMKKRDEAIAAAQAQAPAAETAQAPANPATTAIPASNPPQGGAFVPNGSLAPADSFPLENGTLPQGTFSPGNLPQGSFPQPGNQTIPPSTPGNFAPTAIDR